MVKKVTSQTYYVLEDRGAYYHHGDMLQIKVYRLQDAIKFTSLEALFSKFDVWCDWFWDYKIVEVVGSRKRVLKQREWEQLSKQGAAYLNRHSSRKRYE